MRLTWLGHASFKLEGDVTIFIDPYAGKYEGKADIILITHAHYDHFSKEIIEQLRVDETVIVGPKEVIAEMDGEIAEPGSCIEVKGVKIEVVQAYNVNKPNHPKGSGVGYIIDAGKRVYHAGDTDLIPEMNVYECDIALLPVGGTYTMDAKEAIGAVVTLLPEVVIPMHYGEIVGQKEDAIHFKEEVEKETEVVVRVLDPDSSIEW